MQHLFILMSLFCLGTGHPTGADKEPNAPLVTTQQGPIRGISVDQNVNAFLGIPYAQPPVHSLRFMAPQPLAPVIPTIDHPVRNATAFGPVCYQFHYNSVMGNALIETSGQSEDCLTLNVFVPKRRPCKQNKPMSVFVWSFGGAFGEGGGSMPMFNPTNFVARNKDIIVVTWNYRTTLFGFPNSPALTQQNLGIRDQRVALEWVRDNIAGFGGDPNHIVLGGQSSGADSGNAMLYTHKEDPIAIGAVFQSGTVQIIGASTSNQDSEFIRVANSVGCADSANRTRELECMQKTDADILHRAISNSTLNAFGAPPGGSPMVDNETLFTLQEYDARGRAGRFAKIPTLIGSLDDEGEAIVNWSKECGINKTTAASITPMLQCNVALESRYRHLNQVPTWRYRYRGIFPGVTPYQWLGSYHESDVAILLGSFESIEHTEKPSPITAAASQYLQLVVATFIRNPTSGLRDVYKWPTYNSDKRTLVQLFANNSIGATLTSPTEFDAICNNLPPFSWEAVGAPAPVC